MVKCMPELAELVVVSLWPSANVCLTLPLPANFGPHRPCGPSRRALIESGPSLGSRSDVCDTAFGPAKTQTKMSAIATSVWIAGVPRCGPPAPPKGRSSAAWLPSRGARALSGHCLGACFGAPPPARSGAVSPPSEDVPYSSLPPPTTVLAHKERSRTTDGNAARRADDAPSSMACCLSAWRGAALCGAVCVRAGAAPLARNCPLSATDTSHRHATDDIVVFVVVLVRLVRPPESFAGRSSPVGRRAVPGT